MIITKQHVREMVSFYLCKLITDVELEEWATRVLMQVGVDESSYEEPFTRDIATAICYLADITDPNYRTPLAEGEKLAKYIDDVLAGVNVHGDKPLTFS